MGRRAVVVLQSSSDPLAAIIAEAVSKCARGIIPGMRRTIPYTSR